MSYVSDFREAWNSGMTENTSFQPDSVPSFLPIIPGSSIYALCEWQSQTLQFFGGFPRAQKPYSSSPLGNWARKQNKQLNILLLSGGGSGWEKL